MSVLFPRNIAGYSTIDTLLLNGLEIQTQGVGNVKIYVDTPEEPIFLIDGLSGTITTRGTLNVLGTASFTTTTLSNTTQSLFQMALNNIEDKVDIGIFGEYKTGGLTKYSALFRDASDPAKRWFMVDGFTCTPPISNVPAFTYSNFVGLVANSVTTNDGTAANPAFNFYSNTNTGIYLSSINNLGVAVGGIQIINAQPTLFASLVAASISDTTQSTSTTTGALTIAGGVGVAKNLYVGGVASISDTTQSTSTTTGALTIAGGVGVEKNLYVGGVASISDTTLSTINYKINISSNASIDLPTLYTAGNLSYYYKLTANIVNITLPTGATHSGRTFKFYWTGTTYIEFTANIADTIGTTGSNVYRYTYTTLTNIIFNLAYDGVSNWFFI